MNENADRDDQILGVIMMIKVWLQKMNVRI